MAYMNQDKKALIAAALKPILKKYGIKGSLAVRNHSTIVLNIKAGKIDFIKNFNETVVRQPRYNDRQFTPAKDSIQVNPYWFQEHFSGTAVKALQEIFRAMKGAGWYDNSDAQTDYFDTAYYVDVNIGRWNQPYTVVA